VTFRAYQVERIDGGISRGIVHMEESDLDDGDVLVEVEWSGLNYKDAMVTQPGNRVARRSPLVPGVDLAGTVRASTDPACTAGDAVLVHGYDLGVARHGGFAELARVPAAWVVPIPEALDPRRAMIVGTAGYTAFASIVRLQEVGITPGSGPVLVTGASGGVGSLAVALLAHLGYEVTASTGKRDSEHAYLQRLGAAEVVGRIAVGESDGRVLGPETWVAAVDCVGGAPLAGLLRAIRYGGAVAASGLTAGTDLPTTVYPFIIRGVALLGVDSVQVPIERRRTTWAELARTVPIPALEEIVSHEIGLDGVDQALDQLLAGKVRGRVLLDTHRGG